MRRGYALRQWSLHNYIRPPPCPPRSGHWPLKNLRSPIVRGHRRASKIPGLQEGTSETLDPGLPPAEVLALLGLVMTRLLPLRPCTHKSRLVSSGWSMSALPPKADIRQRRSAANPTNRAIGSPSPTAIAQPTPAVTPHTTRPTVPPNAMPIINPMVTDAVIAAFAEARRWQHQCDCNC